MARSGASSSMDPRRTMRRAYRSAYLWVKIAKGNSPFLRGVRLLKREPEVTSYGSRRILSASEANDLLRERVAHGVPTSAGKIGDIELEVLVRYEQANHDPDEFFDAISRRGPELDLFHLNCGVFPKEKAVLVDWAETYLGSLSNIDLLGVWFNSGEEAIVGTYAPSATLARIQGVEPYYHQNPWTKSSRTDEWSPSRRLPPPLRSNGRLALAQSSSPGTPPCFPRSPYVSSALRFQRACVRLRIRTGRQRWRTLRMRSPPKDLTLL